MNSRVKQLNLSKYLPFFLSAPAKNCLLAIHTFTGKVILSEPSEKQSERTLQHLSKKIDWDQITGDKTYLSVNGIGHVFISALVLGANEQLYYLLGFQEKELALSSQQIDELSKKTQHIATCLAGDYTQTEIITGMADELSVRYEELNLLYGMDDINSLKNNDEECLLQQITQNCIEYLNIDYAAIYIPDQDFFFHLFGHNSSIAEGNYLEQVICQHLYDQISINPETVVINRNSSIDWTDANLKNPNKLIAAPVLNANLKLCGLLVLIKSVESPDFSNSDRKLAEVLAAEASKLVQARRDPLTGQFNRRGFTEKLEKTLAERQSSSRNSCLLVIDLDQFKLINDTAGQAGGDQLLRQITVLILKNLKQSDILARLGSDEFAIILKQCNIEHATNIAERIRLAIKQFRFLYKEKMFDLSTCLGVVELNSEIKDFSQALGSADLACTVAKEQGRNRVHIYTPTDERLLKHESQMLWISRINIALEEDQFLIYRQKIELLQGDPGTEEHYEILIRLKEKKGTVLSPFHFIPAAERYHLMPKIDRWVIKTTLEKMAETFNKNSDSKLICSINLSGQSFSDDSLVHYIQEQLEKNAVPANKICLEITETAAVSNLTQAVKFMEQLKAIGCHFSLDDFGSGMSSFTYLKNLPVDYLKIDGYFVKTMLENKIDKAMVNAIYQIGSVMGLKIIAEFVENEDIMNELRMMGVDYGQGYGIGKPEPFI